MDEKKLGEALVDQVHLGVVKGRHSEVTFEFSKFPQISNSKTFWRQFKPPQSFDVCSLRIPFDASPTQTSCGGEGTPAIITIHYVLRLTALPGEASSYRNPEYFH